MAENSSSDCFSADDCSTDGIIRECYVSVKWTPETNFCDCNFSPGWQGATCDETSPMLNFSRTFNVAVIVFTTVMSIMIIIDLGYIASIKHKHDLKQNISVPFPAILTGVATLLSYWCHFANAIIELSVLIKPNQLKLVEGKPGSSVVSTPHQTLSIVFLFPALGFTLVAELQITLSWLKVTEKMEIFHVFSSKTWQKAIKIYKVFAQITSWMSIAVVLGCGLSFKTRGLAAVVPMFILLVNVLVLIGRKRFISVVRTISSGPVNEARYTRPLFLVRTASFYSIFFCFSVIAMIIIGQIVEACYPAAHGVQPGRFNYSAFLSKVTLTFGYGALITYQWYFHNILYGFRQIISSGNKMRAGVIGYKAKSRADNQVNVDEVKVAADVEEADLDKISPSPDLSL